MANEVKTIKVKIAEGRGNFYFNDKKNGVKYSYKRSLGEKKKDGTFELINPVFSVPESLYEQHKDALVKA